MLEELLLSMVGYSGGLFKNMGDSIEVDPSVDSLTQAEKTILNKFSQLGYRYTKIKEFVDETKKFSLEQIKNKVHGLKTKGMVIENEEMQKPNLKSVYMRKVGICFERVLDRYYDVVMRIEEKFLGGEMINLNKLHIDFGEFFYLFQQMIDLISQLIDDDESFSNFIDNVFEWKLNGNDKIRDFYTDLFESLYDIFFEFLSQWINFGKVDDFEKNNFFIKKMTNKNNKNKIIDWDSDFIIQYAKIPKNLINSKTAKKILFIGKAIKILIKEEGLAIEAVRTISELLERIRKYDSFIFEKTIEEIRCEISRKFIDLVVKKNVIIDDLENLRRYYLLTEDYFYNVFIEEGMEVFDTKITKYTEYDINNRVYPNSLIQLGFVPNNKKFKQLRFIVKTYGFNYPDFLKIANLQLVGDIERNKHSLVLVSPSKYVLGNKLNPQPSIWHSIKQAVEFDFENDFAFRFKKEIRRNYHNVDSKKEVKKEMLCLSFIIQNQAEVKSYKTNKALFNLSFLKEYLIINFGFFDENTIIEDETMRAVSFITIYHKKVDNKESIKLFERKFKEEELNFADQDFQHCRIKYKSKQLCIYLKNQKTSNFDHLNVLASLSIDLSKTINFDLSRAFIGFINNSSDSLYNIELYDWTLRCEQHSSREKCSYHIIPHYSIKWPNSIVLNPILVSKLETIYSTLFNYKLVKFKLRELFINLNKDKTSLDDASYYLANKTRVHLTHLITVILGYIFIDVIEEEWAILADYINVADDFDGLRKKINTFVTNIYNKLFFRYPDLIRYIDSIFSLGDSFCYYVKFFRQKTKKERLTYTKGVLNELKSNSIALIKFLYNICDKGLDKHFLKLITRLNYNDYFDSYLVDVSLN